MLAGDLAALEVERIAVAVVRRHSEDADLAIVFEPPQLAIIGDVAPHEIPALSVPCRPLGPQRPGPQASDRAVLLRVLIEERIDRDDVGVPEVGGGRSIGAEIAGWASDRAWRCGPLRLSHRAP